MSSTGVIYISGPMTGLPGKNFPRFFEVEKELKAKGINCINPAKLEEDPNDPYEEILKVDLIHMLEYATGLYMLKGWEKSRGALVEWAIAKALNWDIYYEGQL